MDMQTLGDRLDINDLLTRYAHSVDSKDWTLYRSVFTDDAFIDYESAGGIKGDREAVANWLEKTMAGFPMTQHLISNVDVKIDGDRALWNKHANQLRDDALRVLDIVKAKNVDALFAAGSDIDRACENCHLEYWYPGDKAAVLEDERQHATIVPPKKK